MFEIFKRVVNNEDLANLEKEVNNDAKQIKQKDQNDKKMEFI